jgi:hypothetical protein
VTQFNLINSTDVSEELTAPFSGLKDKLNKQQSFCILRAGILFGSSFAKKDGGELFLRNVS